MARIIAVCQSEKVGIRKEPIPEGIIKEAYGMVGDAHADTSSHRQVSLIALESIAKMREMGFD
ncbi:MAG: MOSC domain-containing protein, partial [Dehalococcoidia bacterium]|nr:MOSC domain-containing protein [Dehalococcoidia bacterium]